MVALVSELCIASIYIVDSSFLLKKLCHESASQIEKIAKTSIFSDSVCMKFLESNNLDCERGNVCQTFVNRKKFSSRFFT